MNFLPTVPIELDPPKAPLRGNLELTGGQEKALLSHFLERINTIRRSYHADGWIERRNQAMRHYENNMEDRKQPGTIFEKSNLSLNLPKRYCRITTSRVYDELLTSVPLIAVSVEGPDDLWEDCRVIERYCAWKMEQANVRQVFREAEALATIRGETVVKTTWNTKSHRYYKTAVVLVDPETGEEIRSKDGNPVLQTDTFDDGADGSKVLKRDPDIKLVGMPTWEERRVECRKKIYNGIEMACVDHRDFYCNATESDIHKADFNALMVDFSLDEVHAMLVSVKDNPDTQEFLQRLENSSLTGEGKSHANKANEWRGEEERHKDALPQCSFAEIYARVMLDESGQSVEIAALLDLENEQLLTYDYLDNISPTGKRPFRVVRMEPVPHRWYGTGFYELFADRHRYCDLYMNRVNLASSLSGNIKIENPMATEEGLAGEPIEFGTTKTYRLRDGYNVEDVFKVISIPNDSTNSENLLQLLMQVSQLEAGIVSAGDHGMAGLPAAGLATGIKSLDRVANVLLKNILFDFISGFEALLMDSVNIILTRFDESEAALLMGSESANRLAGFRDVSQLPFKIVLKLSGSKDSEVIENHTRAFEMLVQFEQMPPEARARMRPILMKILTVMGIEDVDMALSDMYNEGSMADGSEVQDMELDTAEQPTGEIERGPVEDDTVPDVNKVQE